MAIPAMKILSDLSPTLTEEVERLRAECKEMLVALEGMVNNCTVECAEKWGFGPHRQKVSEVYDKIKWGNAKGGRHE